MQNSIRVIGTCCILLLLSIFFINQRQQARGQGALPQLGVSFAQYDAGAYATPLSNESVEKLANAGAEWINIVVTQYQFDLNTTNIYPTGKTPTNADLIHIISKAKSLGLKVSLKPHIDIQSNPREWRGRIGRDFNEQQWTDWFASYEDFIGGYADLSAAQGVDQLIVGTELVSTVQRELQWRDVIAFVRGKYGGTLTYSANHSGEETSIAWWDALDLIGVSGYYDLTDSTNPSVADLKAAWQPHRDTLAGLNSQFGKPILFTEVGYRSSDGNNRHPWCYWCDEPMDLQEQADGYQAYFEVFFNEPWFAGVHVWGWRIEPERSGPCNDGYSPYNKPAENIMRQYFGASTRGISTVCDPNAPVATPTPTATLPPQPTDVPTYAIINATSGTPVIDGSAEFLWQSANGYKVDTVLWGGEQPAADFKADFRALYDANYLYLFVDVQDDQLVQDSGAEWWRDDVIEIYLDGDLSGGSSYDGVNDYQFFFRWDDPVVHTGSGSDTSDLANNIQFELLTATNGYVAEIAIPLATLGISPADGTEFGLDVQVIDDHNGGAGDTKYSWHATTDNAWQTPSLFGTARLFGQVGLGSTPTPTAPPAATSTLPPTATPVPPVAAGCGGLEREAEAGVLLGLFEPVNDSSASDGAYVHVPLGNGNRGTTLDSGHKVSLCFTVANAGRYRVNASIFAPDSSRNSFYVRIDDAPAAGITHHAPINSSVFIEQTVAEVDLDVGTHTVDFFWREHDTRLDKVVLEPSGSATIRRARVIGSSNVTVFYPLFIKD